MRLWYAMLPDLKIIWLYTLFAVHLLVTATYKRAREKVAMSEKTSDINTDVEQEHTKKRARYI